MRTTRLAKKKSLFCSALNLMPWILWGKPFIFCLVQQFKQPMFQTRSVQKTSRRTRRTALQTPATVCYQDAASISAPASCVPLMTPAPRSSCNYQGAGGTSIIFSICYLDQPRITKQGKLIYRAAQRMAGTKSSKLHQTRKMLQKQPSAASFHPFHKAAIHNICCIHQPPALKPLILNL